MRTLPLTISLTAVLLASSTALAYPTSVVFAPSGDGKGLGDMGAYLYASSYDTPYTSIGAGATWAGLQVGILPRFDYGSTGSAFGGLEIGADLILSDLAGTPDAYIKPIFNTKLLLATESGWLPHLSLGIMSVSPGKWNRSVNFLYGSATKTLQVGETYLGRLTLGAGGSLGDFSGDSYKDVPGYEPFYGTFPFGRSSRAALIAGYESPNVGPLYLAVDHIGGYSEFSSTNIALSLIPMEGAYFAVGGNLGSDPDNWFWGFFTYVQVNWNLPKVFGGGEPAAAAPASAPAAAPAAAPEPPAASPSEPPATSPSETPAAPPPSTTP